MWACLINFCQLRLDANSYELADLSGEVKMGLQFVAVLFSLLALIGI